MIAVNAHVSTNTKMNSNNDYFAWVVLWHRLRFRAERSIPLGFDQRLQAYLCGKGGAIIGDLPPYEAFPIGGTASVRGYGEGSVGSGRNYVAGTAELHFPLVAPFEVCVYKHGKCHTVHVKCDAQLCHW